MDWIGWHRDYDEGGALARRLVIVRRRIIEFMDSSPLPSIRVISMCAGDGRDLIGALAEHPRRKIVRGRLVELDPTLAGAARTAAAAAGLALDVVEADAGRTDAYAGAVPADLVLACGVFGNISDRDVEGTISALPMLLSAGGTVIWTRHRRVPDLTRTIRGWFARSGFAEVSFEPVPDSPGSVGVVELTRPPRQFRAATRLFAFNRQA